MSANRITTLKTSLMIAAGVLMLAACSSDKINFPPTKPAPISKAITAAPYLSNGIYVCPMPVPLQNAKIPREWERPLLTQPIIPEEELEHQSIRTITEFLCYQGVVIYWTGDTLNMVVPSDLIFFPNSPGMRYKANPILDRVAAVMHKYNANPINISVYTDTILPRQQSMALSKGQANRVKTYFWGDGIAMQCMNAQGYGSGFQIGSQWTQAGNAENRRIEISFMTHNSGS